MDILTFLYAGAALALLAAGATHDILSDRFAARRRRRERRQLVIRPLNSRAVQMVA